MTPIETYSPSPRMPLWARMLGATYWTGDGSVRTKIGEVSYRYRGLAFDFGSYGEPHLHFGLLFFAVFFPLPTFFGRWLYRHEDGRLDNPRYGFSWRWSDGADIHLHWGQRYWIIYMPWMLEHIRTDYLGKDLQWWDQRAEPDSFYRRHPSPHHRYDGPEGPAKWSETHPYRYMLQSGQVQEVSATITRRRALHGRRWFGSGPVSRLLRSVFPRHRFESIDVEFSGELGERAGSWKGGCIGCSYNMRPEESPRQTLMRMQRERRFR